jgi:hypothetical protein
VGGRFPLLDVSAAVPFYWRVAKALNPIGLIPFQEVDRCLRPTRLGRRNIKAEA